MTHVEEITAQPVGLVLCTLCSWVKSGWCVNLREREAAASPFSASGSMAWNLFQLENHLMSTHSVGRRSPFWWLIKLETRQSDIWIGYRLRYRQNRWLAYWKMQPICEPIPLKSIATWATSYVSCMCAHGCRCWSSYLTVRISVVGSLKLKYTRHLLYHAYVSL